MGLVKLTDFGVSSELQNSIGTTRRSFTCLSNFTGSALCATFVGTFKYMSPERIRNKPYSYASDIWSLGIVLIQCATGEYPYPETSTYIEVNTALES